MENKSTEERNFHVSQLAHWSQRLVNYLVDRIVIIGIAILIAPLFSGFLYAWGSSNIGYFIIIEIISFLYYVPFEYYTGKTLGKYLTKTTVLTDGGKKPSFGVIFTRTLGRFIPAEAFSSINMQGHGWHNTISKTIVLPDSEV